MKTISDLFKNKEDSGKYRFMTRNISRSGTATIGVHEVYELDIPLLENIWDIDPVQDGYYPLLIAKMPNPLFVFRYTIKSADDLKKLHNIDIEEQIIKAMPDELTK